MNINIINKATRCAETLKQLGPSTMTLGRVRYCGHSALRTTLPTFHVQIAAWVNVQRSVLKPLYFYLASVFGHGPSGHIERIQSSYDSFREPFRSIASLRSQLDDH